MKVVVLFIVAFLVGAVCALDSSPRLRHQNGDGRALISKRSLGTVDTSSFTSVTELDPNLNSLQMYGLSRSLYSIMAMYGMTYSSICGMYQTFQLSDWAQGRVIMADDGSTHNFNLFYGISKSKCLEASKYAMMPLSTAGIYTSKSDYNKNVQDYMLQIIAGETEYTFVSEEKQFAGKYVETFINDANEDASGSFKHTFSSTKSITVSSTVSYSYNQKITVKADVLNSETSFTVSTSTTNSQTTSNTESIDASLTVTIPANTCKQVTATLYNVYEIYDWSTPVYVTGFVAHEYQDTVSALLYDYKAGHAYYYNATGVLEGDSGSDITYSVQEFAIKKNSDGTVTCDYSSPITN